jgi:hypothetical protein
MGIGFFDFSDIDPAKVGDGTGSALPDGFYVGRLVSAVLKPAKTGTPQVELKIAVVGGAADGAERMAWQTLPTDNMEADKKKNLRNLWVRIFQSFGFSPEEIKSFGNQLSAEHIPVVLAGKGGQCFFQWANGNKDLQEKPALNFVTQAKYQKEQEAAAAAVSAQVAAPSAVPGVSVIAPGMGAAPVVPGMAAPGAALFGGAPVAAPTAPVAPAAPGFPFPGAAPAAPGFPFPGAAPAAPAGAPVNPVLAAMGIR